MPSLPSLASKIQAFDSVMSLSRFVGQAEIVSEIIAIDQPLINKFAQLTRDKQWIHIDPERAKTQSPYQHTIAHGFLLLSLLTHWQASCIAFPGATMVLNYGFDKIRFTAPVLSNSQVLARFALKELVQTRPSEARCTWNVTIQAQGAPRPAVYAQWQIMVRYAQAGPN